MESIEELTGKLKNNIGEWEGIIYHRMCNLACNMTPELLARIDDELMTQRDPDLKVVGMRERIIITVFGDISIKRRLYRDAKGGSHFLLDEAMGLEKRGHLSPKVKELAALISSHIPFQMTEEILKTILPSGISHTTIHRQVSKLTEPSFRAEEKELEEVYRGGVIPESEGKAVPHLFIEADGTFVALQREKSRRIELKAGIAYEGWRRVGKDRYQLANKTAYSGVMDGGRFWEGFSLTLARKYDLTKIGRVIVGGDGARWVKDGADLLGGIYQLDRFHLLRALNQTLEGNLVTEVYRACNTGDITGVDRLLAEAQIRAKAHLNDKAGEIARLRGYLLDNAGGLRDYRMEVAAAGLRGLGAMESNVDKLIANRMKKRGMSWRIRGAQRMARLICLRETGELQSWAANADITIKLSHFQKLQKKGSLNKTDTGEWLFAGIPAIHGPLDRPWTYTLRNWAHGAYHG